MEELKIIYLPLDALSPYEKNTRKHEETDLNAIKNSIQQFQMCDPIGIWGNKNIIVEGHGRLLALKALGHTQAPCIRLDHLTDEQRRAYGIAHNKTAELSDWDFDLLQQELAELQELDFDMQQFGFDLSGFEEETEIIEDEVPEVDEENEPITKRGDIWKLGVHYLKCGDATKAEDVNALMTVAIPEKAQLFLTDPPYNVNYEGCTDEELTIQNDDMSDNDFVLFLQSAFENADKHLNNGGAFYIWHASRTQNQFEQTIPWEIRQQLIWKKNSMVLGRQDYQWKHEPCFYGWKEGAPHKWYNDRSQTTVLEFNKPNKNGEHPTMKPVELIAYQMCNSVAKGETVLDLFGGSGTTLIAAEQTGRKCRMLELDERYADVIVKRWETLTGEKAVLING